MTAEQFYRYHAADVIRAFLPVDPKPVPAPPPPVTHARSSWPSTTSTRGA